MQEEWLKYILALPKKISVSIDSPYIDFYFIKATPALVLGIAYFILLVIVCCYNEKKDRIKLHFLRWDSYSEGRKKHIIRAMGGFAVGSIVCWIAPPFFAEDSLLVKTFENYLQYEPIIAVGIFLFLCSALLTAKNKDKHIEAANKILQFMLPISVGIGLFERHIDLCFWPNWIVIIFAYIVYFMLLVTDSEVVVDDGALKKQSYDISYNPVEKVEQLFPQHKAQAERIANIIADSSSDPFSICLSGKWGTGKTSVINGVIELLSQKDKDNYAFIRINALELDDKKTLLTYFMSEVKSSLKERGIYVGIASEYKEFLVSTVGTVTTESFGTFFQKRIFGGEKDYREQKNNLENLLCTAFKEGKLVLIVDDIERCQPDVARDYLFLIKEVATMKNCVSIFVTEYSVLINLLKDDKDIQTRNTGEESNDFLDKFFNYRINLYDETPKDIFAFYDRSLMEEDSAFKSIYDIVGVAPGTWYKCVLEAMDLRIKEQEESNMRHHLSKEDEKIQENKLRGMKNNRTTFMQYMQNPRRVVKFYNAFRRNMHRCYNQLFRFVTEENEKSLVSKFVRTRNIGQIVSFLSFLEVCMPDELQQIIENGADYIEPVFYQKDVIISKDQEFLRQIASVTVYRKDSELQTETSYIRLEKRRFINRFLEPKFDLHQLIKPFDSQEDEWKNAIENSVEESIDLYWNEMVNMVLEKMPNDISGITNEWKEETFANLLEYANGKVGRETWNIDKVFSIFGNDKKGRLFASGKGLLQIFWDKMQKLNATTALSEESVNDVINFSIYYSYYKVDSTYKLFQYISAYKESSTMINIKEVMLNSTRTLEENMLEFANRISGYVPDLCPESDGWYKKLQAITKYIRNYIEEQGLLKYKDVSDEVEHMLDSVNELVCLSKILTCIQKENATSPNEKLSVESYSQINKTIQYFEKTFRESKSDLDLDVEKQFSNFFMYLKDSPDIKINAKQIEQLHDLVTFLVEKTGSFSLFYRKVLLDMSHRNTGQSNVEEKT